MDIKKLIGQKRKRYFNELLEPYFLSNIETYVEPFAGSFAVSTFLKNRPNILVYNDIKNYDNLIIDADYIEHLDYRECINKWDDYNTVFYLDPPYYGKEDLYNKLKFDDQFHEELFNILNNIKGKFIMSYNDNSYIKRMYKDFNIYGYNGENPYIKEITITNYENK